MKKYGLFISLIMSFATSFPAFGASKLEDVTICYFPYREEMTTAALYTADKKGFFEQNGIKVHWKKNFTGPFRRDLVTNFAEKGKFHGFKQFPTEITVIDRLDSGECDVASTTFEIVVGRGFPSLHNIMPIAVYRYGKDYDTHLAERKDLNLKSISDLKGKRVRASSIGVLIVLGEILKAANLTFNDIDVSLVDVPTLPESFDKKEVDLVLAYVPTVPLLIVSGHAKIFEKNVYSKYLKDLSIPHSMLASNQNFMIKKAATFQKFMKAFKQGAQEMMTHPENVVFGADIIEYPDKTYTKADVEKSLSLFKVQMPAFYDTPGKDLFKEAQFAEYQEKMVKEGYLLKSADLSFWKNELSK